MHLSTFFHFFIHLLLWTPVNPDTDADNSWSIFLSQFSKDKMRNNLAFYAKIV